VIVGDDAGKGRQLAEERSDERILPLPVDVSGPMGLPDDVDRPIAIDTVSDVATVLWTGVAEGRSRPHAPDARASPSLAQASVTALQSVGS
jgi:hypothetical protein